MIPGTNSAQIEAAAAEWFAKREGGEWTAAQQLQLDAWLDASTAHRIAFIRLAAAWEHSGRLNALGAGIDAGTIPARGSWGFAASAKALPSAQAAANIPIATVARPRRFPRQARAAAAALALGIAAAGWYVSTDHTESYRTKIGAISTVPLADGSRITLNTDSTVQVELNANERRVRLERGEAFFDVSKDAARPFVVEIGDKRVIAVGTQFSVRRDNDEIRVLVAEGRVRIERPGTASKPVQTQVAAGSEARTSKTALLVDQSAAARVEQVLSWRTGQLIFRDTGLAEAVADFNRYSARKIVIQDPALGGIRIGGSFRSGDVDAFLWLLQSGFPIAVERRGDRIILTKR